MARRRKGLFGTRRIKGIVRKGRRTATRAMAVRDLAIFLGVPVTGIVTYLVSTVNLPVEVTQIATPLGLLAILAGVLVLFA